MEKIVFKSMGGVTSFVASIVLATPVLAQSPESAADLFKKFKENAASAETAARTKRQTANETARFLESLRQSGQTDSTHFKFIEAQALAESKEAAALEATADNARQKVYHAEKALQEATAKFKGRPLPMLALPREPVPPAACTLEGELEIRKFDPGNCLKEVSASQGSTSLPDRPVDEKGTTATIAISGDATKVTFKFANAHNLRWVKHDPRSDSFRQRRATLGYNVGIQATNVAESGGRVFALGEKDKSRSLAELDRLDEKAKVTGGISLNWFSKVQAAELEKTVSSIVHFARLACQADYSATSEECKGPALLRWIQEHPTHADALSAAYWGTGQNVAEWGIGLQGEIARPAFEYFAFPTQTVVDPLDPSKTTEVIDFSELSEGFPQGAERVVKTPFLISLYAFKHFPVRGQLRNLGVTLVGSGTWKRSYEIRKPNRDVIICPPNSGEPVRCHTVNIAAPVGRTDYLASAEVRTLFKAGWIFPKVGIAPKFTWELERGRRSLDVPFYLAADKEGTLHGGLRVKWDSGGRSEFDVELRNEVLLSIFFGTNFDFNLGR